MPSFPRNLGCWDKSYQSLLGDHNICPLLEQFQVANITQLGLTSLTHLKAWGNPEKFCSDVAFY